MIQSKFFIVHPKRDVEKEVNDFLQQEGIEYVDIRVGGAGGVDVFIDEEDERPKRREEKPPIKACRFLVVLIYRTIS